MNHKMPPSQGKRKGFVGNLKMQTSPDRRKGNCQFRFLSQVCTCKQNSVCKREKLRATCSAHHSGSEMLLAALPRSSCERVPRRLLSTRVPSASPVAALPLLAALLASDGRRPATQQGC